VINDRYPTCITINNNRVIESIIDVTLARGGGVVDISGRTMSEDNKDIGSDHKTMEIVWGEESSKGTSQVFAGWNIDSMQEQDLMQTKEWWKEWSGKRDTLSDNSRIQQPDDEATVIRQTLTEVLNQKAKKLTVCARSKRWWNQVLQLACPQRGHIRSPAVPWIRTS
jgi:hypothetical protein